MELSNRKQQLLANQLYDPFRQIWVKSTPEEQVRQKILKQLIVELAYLPQLILIEKQLKYLPHLILSQEKIPKRRVDMVCYAIEPDQNLFPFLLVECKAIDIHFNTLQQVISYNDFVKARFVAVANEKKVITGCFNARSGCYEFQEGLPSYTQTI